MERAAPAAWPRPAPCSIPGGRISAVQQPSRLPDQTRCSGCAALQPETLGQVSGMRTRCHTRTATSLRDKDGEVWKSRGAGRACSAAKATRITSTRAQPLFSRGVTSKPGHQQSTARIIHNRQEQHLPGIRQRTSCTMLPAKRAHASSTTGARTNLRQASGLEDPGGMPSVGAGVVGGAPRRQAMGGARAAHADLARCWRSSATRTNLIVTMASSASGRLPTSDVLVSGGRQMGLLLDA